MQRFFSGNKQAHVSKDDEQKDETNPVRWQQEPVEKRQWKAQGVEELVGEVVEREKSAEADQRQPAHVLGGVEHVPFDGLVAASTGGVVRSARFPPSVHCTPHCAKPTWG